MKGFVYEGKYVCFPMITIIEDNRTLHNKKLQEIVLFDRAEATLGLGQINLRKTSSFCEPDCFVSGVNIELFEKEFGFKVKPKGIESIKDNVYDYNEVSIYNMMYIKRKKFKPGSHVCCACEYEMGITGDDMYSGIGIGVPDNKDDAILFMESVGKTEKTTDDEIIRDLVESIKQVGMNQGIEYKEIYVAYQHKVIRTDLGCAMVITPYFKR